MHDQPRYEPLELSAFFANGMASRPPIEGTIARGQLREDNALYLGKDANDAFLTALPMPVDRPLLERGQQRFDIFCSPCHGRLGDGQGMVVQRGFKKPPSYHTDPLLSQPVGYYYDVMTNGFGVMSSYASQISVEDRWAIAAYIRALQLSQAAPSAGFDSADRQALPSGATEPTAGGATEPPPKEADDADSGGH
ncbi:MAG: cytochrome c [Thermoanaerobaculia bacterium]|nr:cytochrome c [Thermoanaerobaculia bacterium]